MRVLPTVAFIPLSACVPDVPTVSGALDCVLIGPGAQDLHCIHRRNVFILTREPEMFAMPKRLLPRLSAEKLRVHPGCAKHVDVGKPPKHVALKMHPLTTIGVTYTAPVKGGFGSDEGE